jgi:hypothetical protein
MSLNGILEAVGGILFFICSLEVLKNKFWEYVLILLLPNCGCLNDFIECKTFRIVYMMESVFLEV